MMDLRNQVKQILRMCGHAVVSTIHDRLNGMDQQIAGIVDQNTSLARTQTALLQSSVHTVETLECVQTAIRQDCEQTRQAVEQARQEGAARQSVLASMTERLAGLQDDGIAIREYAETLRGRVEEALATLARTEESHTALLQSSIRLLEMAGDAQRHAEGHEAALGRLDGALARAAAAQEAQWSLVQSCVDGLQAVRQEQSDIRAALERLGQSSLDAVEALRRDQQAAAAGLADVIRGVLESLQASRDEHGTAQAERRELLDAVPLIRACVERLAALAERQEGLSRWGEEARRAVEQLLREGSDSHRAQADLLGTCLAQAGSVRQRVEELVDSRNGTAAAAEQAQAALAECLARHSEALQQDIATLAGAGRETAERVAGLAAYTRDVFEQELVRQVAVETNDYAFSNPEVGLMEHLYSYLPTRKALDVGAHVGDVSEQLLRAGYEVYAFEPYPPSFEALVKRLGCRKGFHPFPLALGRIEAELPLHLAADLSPENRFDDATVFNTLTAHSMPDDLPFTDTVLVPVRNLDGLHREGALPEDISLLKIDTEGYDLEVVRGMGERRYPVVAAEFWDTRIPFGRSGLLYTLESLTGEMRARDYPWHIVLYRIWGRNHTAFYANHGRSVAESWGNVFFFRDYDCFAQAQAWCSAVLPRTYFKPAPSR